MENTEMEVIDGSGEDENLVKRLDDDTATALRRGQVISRVSDVVRELVDNSIDAEASSIQVHLIKYGVDKIEVRDTGKGISSIDVRKAVAGGHTSKLKNTNHLSCSSKQYGFRGEALSSICVSGNVTLITKNVKEAKAVRYVLNNRGEVVSENAIARGQGTTVTVEKIFSHLPVRRQRAQEKAIGVAELKEIESYLKSLAIVNPKIHMSLYHDSSLVWTKASVPSVDQALISVLGHNLAKHLTKCGPVDVDVDEEEKRKRTVELFVPKLPIDANVMGMSNRRLSMIYVNRRRVNHLSVFEKEVKRFVDAASNNAFSDKKKFPVFVLCITIPSDEADFNLDMDKSKIFMKNFEEVRKKLTEILKNFYKIDVTGDCELIAGDETGRTDLRKVHSTEKNETNQCEAVPCNVDSASSVVIPTSPILGDNLSGQSRPAKRKANILEFLENIADSSNNFSQSPKKDGTSLFPCNNKVGTICQINNSLNSELGYTQKAGSVQENVEKVPISDTSPLIGNFEIMLDGLEMDSQKEIDDQRSKKSDPQVNMRDWVYGRVLDRKGEIIQNVAVINRPPLSITPETGRDTSSQPILASGASNLLNVGNEASQKPNAFERIGSGLSFRQSVSSPSPSPTLCKRPRLLEIGIGHNSWNSQNSSSGISFSSTPRQITLDASWKTSTKGPSVSPRICQSPAGVRLPLSLSTRSSSSNISQSYLTNKCKSSSSIGIMPKSVLDFWKNTGNRVEKANQRAENTSIDCSSPSVSHIRTRIIGYFGSGYYASRIEDTVGIFSPMQMLQFFPSLKYDYDITLERVYPKETNTSTNNQPKPTLYKVSLDKAEKLFEDFSKLVSPESDMYRKIFHTSVDSVSKFQKQFSTSNDA